MGLELVINETNMQYMLTMGAFIGLLFGIFITGTFWICYYLYQKEKDKKIRYIKTLSDKELRNYIDNYENGDR